MTPMTRTERKKFITKLRKAKKMALRNVGSVWAGQYALFDVGLLDRVYVDPNGTGHTSTAQFLEANGATAKNIAAIFDNSIAAQEALL